MRSVLTHLCFVPVVPNPDEARRRAILARVLVFLVAAGTAVVADSIRQYPLGQILSGDFLRDLWRIEDARYIFFGALAGLLSFGLVWRLNRSHLGRFGWLPGAATLLSITLLVSLADTPPQIINGRSLMLWVLPVALAPLILPSWTAFLAASISSIAIALIAIANRHGINIYAILALYVLAFVSWLSARALEQALRAERTEAEKNRVILENIADGVLVVDSANQVKAANPAARKLLGHYLDALPPEASPRLELPGQVIEFSWAQISGLGRAAVLRDITRQVEIERAKDALLGTVSHELRTPLAAISGFAEVIGMLSQNEKINEMSGRIVANVGRLKGLVNSLLDQAQIQSGTLKLSCADVSPRKLAEDIANLMRGLADEKKLAFTLELDPDLPATVLGDTERLHQVLVNLIGNAIKFTDQGSVTLRMFPLPENRWGFSVTDTGDGIPAARLPDIFEPFRRGADYATRTRQGAGLGLSITKQLVELMGGKIAVTSEVGQGTIFTVLLPAGAQP